MPDPISEHNRKMWDLLNKAGHAYTRPRGRLPRSQLSLLRYVDPLDQLSGLALKGLDLLLLAGGGGWDAIAFSMLGCNTVLFDISDLQLKTVQRLAARRRLEIGFEQGDMKDLSRFRPSSFDIVWHMNSLVFVDEPGPVFQGVQRVLRQGGTYHMETMHPIAMRMYEGWSGNGWNLRVPYHHQGAIGYSDDVWDDGEIQVKAATHEFGHTIQSILNAMGSAGLYVDGLWEHSPGLIDDPEPGSSDHVEATFPALLEVRARKGAIPLRGVARSG